LGLTLLDRAVHAFDLAIGPGVVWLGQAVLDPVGLADHVEPHRSGTDGVSVPGLLDELDAVVGQDRVDAAGHSIEQEFEELPCSLAICLLDQPSHCGLAGPVDGDEETEFAFGRAKFGDVDVEEPDRLAIGLEPMAPSMARRLNRCRFGSSPSMSGKREMPCRWRHRCSEERVRCGIVG
jgi:hypothetical protein